MRSARRLLLVLLLCLAAPGAALAEDDPNALFNQALELAQDGKTEQAIGLWLKVLHKVEDRFRPSVHRTLGLGFGKLGRLPEAAYHLRKHLETRLEAQSKKTRQKLAAIEEKLATTHFLMTIACEPADAAVHLNEDGTGTGYSCPLKWWFPKGRHAVRVARVGYRHSITDITVQEGQEARLHTVSLENAQPGSDEQREAKVALLRNLKQAAKAGQDSVVRAISLEHEALLSELPCEFGWDAAKGNVNINGCNRRVFATLVEAGAKICPTSGGLKNAVELGCPELVAQLLPLLEDEVVYRAVSSLSPTSRYHPTVAQARDFLTGMELVSRRVNDACRKADLDSRPCKVSELLDTELAEFYGAISVRIPDETLLEILALRPKLARKHHCAIVQSLIGGMNYNNLDERVKTLARFHPNDGPSCDYRQSLNRAVVYRCMKAIELLLKSAAAEDVAAASREYNSGDRWLPRLEVNDGRPPVKEVLRFGKRLHQINLGLCKDSGPDSPSCASARYVEEQIDRIKTAQKQVDDPATILKELCAYQHDLDVRMAELAKIRRVSELSGVPSRGESVQLAQYIVTFEASIEEFSKLYKKASRKTFTPKLCK